MNEEYTQRKRLNQFGWDVSKRDSVAFNSGSETSGHIVAKSLIAQIYKEQGYRVSSEVTHPERGEIDLLVYGTDDEPLAIEVETDRSDDIIADKVNRYVAGPIRDVLIVEPPTEDMSLIKAKQYLREQL